MTLTVLEPATEEVLAQIPRAGIEEADAAVARAKAAFEAWRAVAPADRAKLLYGLADALEAAKEDLAQLEARNAGMPIGDARGEMGMVVDTFRFYAGAPERTLGDTIPVSGGVAMTFREPVGVVALITPWNFPLAIAAWKLAPALAAGCTCVIKPTEVTPLSSVLLVRLAEEAGVPPGVVNILLGTGPAVGAPLTAHPDVDMVSFTGGLATGQAIIRASAETVKRVAVALGGKNPNIVFADTDFETVVDNALTAVFLHSGQVCSAGARLIVEESVADELVAELATRADAIRIGNGLDPASQTGPLVSAAHRAKIEDFVASAREEGARVLSGGCRPDDPELAKGYFYRPTVLDGCHRGMRVVREETFGPLLTVERFVDESEAIALGNDTTYGLAGAVWTRDAARAHRVAGALRHGTVWINDFGPYVPGAEWGGMKRSGNGRELGPTGLHEYQEQKHIWHNTAPAPARWFT